MGQGWIFALFCRPNIELLKNKTEEDFQEDMDEEHSSQEEELDEKYGGELSVRELKEILLDLGTVMHFN